MQWYILQVSLVKFASMIDKAYLNANTTQGDDLERDQEIRFSFFRNIKKDYAPEDLVFQDELIQSEDLAPPKYPGGRHHFPALDYCTMFHLLPFISPPSIFCTESS